MILRGTQHNGLVSTKRPIHCTICTILNFFRATLSIHSKLLVFCFCQRQWLASNSSSVIWQLQSMRAIACLIQAAFCATYLEIFGIIWRFSMLDTPWAANASSACSRDRLRVQQWDGTSQSSIPCTQSI